LIFLNVAISVSPAAIAPGAVPAGHSTVPGKDAVNEDPVPFVMATVIDLPSLSFEKVNV